MVEHSHRLIKNAEDNHKDIDSLINDVNLDSSNLINLRPSKNDFNIDKTLEETNDSIFNSRGIIKTGLDKLDSVVLEQGIIYQNINGNKLFLGRIIQGKKAGDWYEFFNNSQIKIKGTFLQGDSVETFSWFNSQGVLLKERIFHKNGITQKKYDYHYDVNFGEQPF